MSIIAVSGKIGSGKDEIGKIIQWLTSDKFKSSNSDTFDRYKSMSYDLYNEGFKGNSNWQIKKFADKLKDIVCLLIGCTREQLEDQEFKNKELGEEWWFYGYGDLDNKIYTVKIPYLESKDKSKVYDKYLIKLTPRLLLQLMGTECGRQILHPNIWVNSLFADYHPTPNKSMEESFMEQFVTGRSEIHYKLPNWIITDMRFPNELKAVKDKGGISIRVNRPYTTVINGNGIPATFNHNQFHESETALDSAEFDFVIENSGSIEELIEKVKIILIELKVI